MNAVLHDYTMFDAFLQEFADQQRLNATKILMRRASMWFKNNAAPDFSMPNSFM
jgi:ATP/maltotriose-dependent transcriptional regulator MalT